jgi:hypothetical protein
MPCVCFLRTVQICEYCTLVDCVDCATQLVSVSRSHVFPVPIFTISTLATRLTRHYFNVMNMLHAFAAVMLTVGMIAKNCIELLVRVMWIACKHV